MMILRSTILLAVLLTIGARPAAAQSTDMDSYALLAIEELRANGLHVGRGNVGVTHGLLLSPRPLVAPTSQVAARAVRLAPYSRCAALFTDGLVGARCGTMRPFAGIVDDAAAEYGLPTQFPCAPTPLPFTQPVPPGHYGDVVVRDGETVILAGGEYAFCSLRTGRHARLEFAGPATVRVRDSLRLSNGSFTGPANTTLDARDIRLFVRGARPHFARRSRVALRLYAPESALYVDNGVVLEGSFMARRIRVGRVTVNLMADGGPTTTTSATTTSTTSTRPTSTTRATTTTTSSSTIPTTTVPTPVEVCGNCLDDDGNGLTDFEDPACCAGPQAFAMTLRRGRIRPRGTTTSRLRLKTMLARTGLQDMNPLAEDVFLQIRPEDGPDVFCAMVPAGRFGKKRGVFRFLDREHVVDSAQHLDIIRIRVRRDGSVRLRTLGKQARLKTPRQGRLQVTVGFRTPAAGDAANRCSSAVSAFRTGRAGRLLAP